MKHQLQLIHEVTLPSTPASITDVEGLIDVACAELSLSEDAYGNILIAVTEAVNNAIIHGNKLDSSLSVHIGVRLQITNRSEGIIKNNDAINRIVGGEIGIALNTATGIVVFDFANNPNVDIRCAGPS